MAYKWFWLSEGLSMRTVVTVGMCVRNCESMIGDAIESIIQQDFPHELMQAIFVDDGSQDHTLEIVQSYVSRMDIKSKVFQTKWQGLGAARNLIGNNAEGDYIVWVDADEVLTESYVRDQVAFMEKHPEVGITAGIVATIPGNLVLNLELIPGIINHMNYDKPKTFLWKTEKLPGTGGATFRTEALRHVRGFDERLSGVGEDQDVAQRMRRAGWAISLNNSPFYEKHGGMLTFNDLLKKYLWYGYGSHKIYRKNRDVFSFPRMSPIAAVVTGFLYSLTAYKLLRQKEVFLLPLHYGLKMSAWMVGFIKSQARI